MLRSQINNAIDSAIKFFTEHHFSLPVFAAWSPKDWRRHSNQTQAVTHAHLGWDVTDFGTGDFQRFGRVIFTLRNAVKGDASSRTYAQKIMHLLPGRKSVIHHHKSKREDIINQAGGNIHIKFWQATSKDQLSKKPVDLTINGLARTVKSGQVVKLYPGESVYVPPLTYHQFWAAAAKPPVLSMEISSVNNDYTDNYFLGNIGARFPQITEDIPARYLLCNEYEKI